MTKEEQYQLALENFQKAIDQLHESIGEHNFNFVCSFGCLNGKDAKWYAIGGTEDCVSLADNLFDEVCNLDTTPDFNFNMN